MSAGNDVLKRIRAFWGGYERWEGEPLKLEAPARKRWRVYCGEGRFDPAKMNGARHQTTGVVVNFQINGAEDRIQDFELCVVWLEPSWSLMFHLDPKRERWPEHPLHHIQFQPPQLCMGIPPFAAWRVPFGESDPVRLLEFIVHRLDADTESG
ncbi:MAG TPA: hypothetical protein VLS89_08795 [Candidatus Nanopelagicales bacterium]|nr:hypothetical protein [Candidatus Nanopelagicales bacterium]